MKKWKIPVVWQMAGIVEIEADSLEEAIDLAEVDDVSLPDGSYIDDSFEVDDIGEDEIRSLYNNDEPDEEECVAEFLHVYTQHRAKDNVVSKRCPECGAQCFIVTAQVKQDWCVNEFGDFIKSYDDCAEVVRYPGDSDTWVCDNCGFSSVGRSFNVTR